MSAEVHLKGAKELYQKAVGEFNRAKERSDGTILRDACGKGWLSAVEATYALLIKKGVKEEELPKRGDRGRRYLAHKYGDKELELYYHSLRNALHIEGYYEGTVEFEEVEGYLEHLVSYIRKIEQLEEEKS